VADQTDTSDGVVVVGAAKHPLRDVYHVLLTVQWPAAIGAIALGFLTLNAFFGSLYWMSGGIAGGSETPASYADCFFFSTQTLGTIGYGTMHPATTAANLVTVVESIVSVVFAALATGIVFARFTRSSESLVFCERPCISPMDGVPTLCVRVGNDRRGAIMDAQVQMTIIRTHRTAEGVTMYRMTDLALVRARTFVLARSFTVMHTIDASSPLHGATPESCAAEELELLVNVVGTDGTSLQPVHGRRRYLGDAIRWGARLADVLSELPDGRLQLDVRRFHDVVPTTPTETFPYPATESR
jgi:inward rectifier potassium channel